MIFSKFLIQPFDSSNISCWRIEEFEEFLADWNSMQKYLIASAVQETQFSVKHTNVYDLTFAINTSNAITCKIMQPDTGLEERCSSLISLG